MYIIHYIFVYNCLISENKFSCLGPIYYEYDIHIHDIYMNVYEYIYNYIVYIYIRYMNNNYRKQVLLPGSDLLRVRLDGGHLR